MKRKAIVVGVLAALAGASLANAQLLQGGYQRLGGPLLYNYGFRPFTLFNNGQYAGYGAYGPYVFMTPDGYPIAGYPMAQQTAPSWQQMAIQPVGDMGSSGAFAIARTNDAIDSQYEKDGTLVVRWEGQPAAVRTVTFALLDAKRMEIKTTPIDRLPAEARFEPNDKAEFLAARIEFVNGTTMTVTTPLRPPKAEAKAPPKGEQKPDEKKDAAAPDKSK